VKQTLDMA